MADTPKLVELSLPVALRDVLKKWSHNAGFFKKDVELEKREKLYMSAFTALFLEFSLSHDKYDDENFVRIFRFFKDAGFLKRVSEEASVCERYRALELQVP